MSAARALQQQFERVRWGDDPCCGLLCEIQVTFFYSYSRILQQPQLLCNISTSRRWQQLQPPPANPQLRQLKRSGSCISSYLQLQPALNCASSRKQPQWWQMQWQLSGLRESAPSPR